LTGRPVSKIETYTGAVLDHTIEPGTDAIAIIVKETLTGGIGTFSFTLPGIKGSRYPYNDIAVNDIVKVWLGYDSISGDPLTKGRIYEITAPLNVQSGYLRHFSCSNQGEILQRRIKTRKVWDGIGASTIVEELCDDLGLGKTEVTADATSVDLICDGETYFDVLRRISDYWASGGSQIKKDFYVDIDNNLVWKVRPIRSAGVETLTVGQNIMSYNLLRDILSVKNKIYVYGQRVQFNPKDPTAIGRKFPVDGDSWTYGTGWTPIQGALITYSTAPKVGSNCLRCISDAGGDCQFYRTFSQLHVEGKAGYTMLEFWGRRDALLATNHHVKIYCPDDSNYYEFEFEDPGSNGVWAYTITSLGENNTYNAVTNPDGEWVVNGSPTWENMQGIEVFVDSGGSFNWDTDGLCLSYGRWRDTAEDATSQSNYGQRDLIIVDDDLASDGDCEKRAETLLYQLKDPVLRLDISTPGNTNIKIGDRLSITIPAENISAVDYDVITVQHQLLAESGFVTRATLVNSANTRTVPPTTLSEVLVDTSKNLSRLGKGVRDIAWRRGG